jgi:hypothetical protein
MKMLISLILVVSMAGCAVCKSSDSSEQCRTKQRNHSQKSSFLRFDRAAEKPPDRLA